MFLYFLLLLGQGGSEVDQALDRFDAAHRTAPGFEATYMATEAGMPQPKEVRVVMDGTNRTAYSSPAQAPTYWYVSSPVQNRERESSELLYKDYPQVGQILLPDKPLSSDIDLYPTWLMAQKREQLTFPKPEWKQLPNKNIAGEDVVMMEGAGKGETPADKVLVQVGIDKVGVVRFYKIDIDTMHMSMHKSWTLTSYKPRTDFKPSDFALILDRGYTPFSVNLGTAKLVKGDKFPLTAKMASGKSIQDQFSGAPGLVAILDDNAPAKAAVASLKRFEGKLPVVTISVSDSQAQYTSEGKSILSLLDPPAFPYFVLVDKDGKILQMWMGFDAAKAEAFQTEVLAALKGE